MISESRFDRDYERNRRAENERTTKKLEAAAKLNTPKLSDFSKSAEHAQSISDDEAYVRKAESHFEEEPGYHAKALEHFVQFAIAQGRLLNDPQNSDYVTEQNWTTRYDDIRNRVDTAATVHVFPEASNDGEEHSIVFGLDLTVNSDPSAIRRKILQGSNDQSADLPAGFSQLKYYRDANGILGSHPCIPRYCIGISAEDVDDFLDRTTIDDHGSIRIRPGTEAIPSFKILYEMSHQNGLFESPLYDKEDEGTLTPEEEQALRDMETIDNIYLKELQRIAKLLPSWFTRDHTDRSGNINIDKVAEQFQSGEQLDLTFTCIIQTISKLEQEYAASGETDYLKKAGERARRTVEQRNQNNGHAVFRTGQIMSQSRRTA